MKYRKKPVEIEAFRYDGDLMGSNGKYYVPDWAIQAFKTDVLYYNSFNNESCELFIKTVEGNRHVSVGDYIIKGVDGELYSCKPDMTYEVVE